MTVEIYDYNSKAFGDVLVCGHVYRIVAANQKYEPLHTRYQSPYQYMYGDTYAYVPDVNIMLTLRPVPPPPPPAPKRTWSSAMGLRRPKR